MKLNQSWFVIILFFGVCSFGNVSAQGKDKDTGVPLNEAINPKVEKPLSYNAITGRRKGWKEIKTT